MSKKHKVLVIAGGGIFGIIPSAFLSFVGNFLDDIDTLSGCSIGGILASSYAAGADPQDVLDGFIEGGDKIFKKRLISMINPIACPTYSNEQLRLFINKYTGDMVLDEVKKIHPNLNLIVPTLNLTDDKYKVFDNISKSETIDKIIKYKIDIE